MEDVKILEIDTTQAQKNVDALNNSLNSITTNMKQVETKINTGFQTASKSMEVFKSTSGKASVAVNTLQSSLGGVGGSLKGLQGMLPALSSGLGSVASGFSSLTKQALAFIANPIGAVIAAVALALKQLVDAFKRNEAAMNAVQKLMAPLKAAWQAIQRIFDSVVSSLTNVINNLNGTNGSFNILSKSLKAFEVVLGLIKASFKVLERNISAVFTVINKLGTAAKNFVDKTPLKGFVDGLANAFEAVKTKAVEFINTVANSKLGKVLGWDIVVNEIKSTVSEMDGLVSDNQKIADLEKEIAEIARKNTTEIAENERKIAELREKASDKEKYNVEERKKFIEEAGNLEAENLEKTKNLRQKEYDLIKLKNSLTTSGTKDLEAEANARAALTKAETDYNNSKRKLNQQLNALNQEAAAAASAAAKAQEEATKAKTQEEKKKAEESLNIELEKNKRIEQSNEDRLKKEIEIENKRLALYDENTLEWEKQQTKIAELENQLTALQNAEKDVLQKSYDDYLKKNEDSNLTYLENLANQKIEETNFLTELREKGIIDEEKYQNQLTNISKKYGKLRAQEHLQNSLAVANGLADILNSIASMQDENNKEGFERSKNLQVAAATINMLTGITAALSGLFTGKTGPWDWILAGVQATTIAASGIANIQKIKNTKFDGNSTSATASTPSASAIGATIMQPTQYTQAVQGAQIEDKIGDTKVYVTETDIFNTMKKVSVQETENRY